MGISAELSGQLQSRFGDRFSTSQALREQHGRGESHHTPAIPMPWYSRKAPTT